MLQQPSEFMSTGTLLQRVQQSRLETYMFGRMAEVILRSSLKQIKPEMHTSMVTTATLSSLEPKTTTRLLTSSEILKAIPVQVGRLLVSRMPQRIIPSFVNLTLVRASDTIGPPPQEPQRKILSGLFTIRTLGIISERTSSPAHAVLLCQDARMKTRQTIILRRQRTTVHALLIMHATSMVWW